MTDVTRHNSRGILLIVLAMAAFTGEDLIIKLLSSALPSGQILAAINTIAAGLFLIMALSQGTRVLARENWRPKLVLRALCEGFTGVFFVTSLAHIDISIVAAVFQIAPLATTLGAAVVLREKVGWRRWSAIFIGFSGVLLIVRPGSASFDPAVLLLLGSVAGVATRDLITRSIDVNVPSSIVAVQGLGVMIPAGIILAWLSDTPFVAMSSLDSLTIAVAAGFGMCGYFALVVAVRIAETGVIMPFRYTRLVFSILAGMLVFHERPDLLTYLGSALIIGSGIYTFLRERKLARLSAAQA